MDDRCKTSGVAQMSSWDPQYALRQLNAMLPPPRAEPPGSGGASSHRANRGPRCGCCPRCRAFVCIEPRRPDEVVPCPSCGRPIGFVKPLEADLPRLE